MIEPPEEVKAAARPIQELLSRFPWLFPVPQHFLHVWIGLAERIDRAWKGWPEVDAFPVEYRGLNCFHTAVVVEVTGPVRRLVARTPNDLPTFLPHMTVAVTRGAASPAALRDALVPLRGTTLGPKVVVREAKRVRFPAARTTLFRPWSVEQVVPLR